VVANIFKRVNRLGRLEGQHSFKLFSRVSGLLFSSIAIQFCFHLADFSSTTIREIIIVILHCLIYVSIRSTLQDFVWDQILQQCCFFVCASNLAPTDFCNIGLLNVYCGPLVTLSLGNTLSLPMVVAPTEPRTTGLLNT